MKLSIDKKKKYIVIIILLFSLILLLTQYYLQNNYYKIKDTKKNNIKIKTIITYYNTVEERQNEMDISCASLVSNHAIDNIHLILENNNTYLPTFLNKSDKVIKNVNNKRQNMSSLFEYSCKHLKNDRVMITNSDILFDSTMLKITNIPDNVFDKYFYAITRWEAINNTLSDHLYSYGSFDTFIFRPNILCNDNILFDELLKSINYPLGVLGIENRLLYEINRIYPNILLKNPMNSIITIHNHNSNIRSNNWSNRVNLDGKSIGPIDIINV